ncbi:MAG TPA: hypothetical protein VLM85_31075 [Polyangiaceae bacterium]|nr:hypothetical protein [Polyangiaceae bacterium]
MRLVAVALGTTLIASACATDPIVPLIQLTEVAPRQIELGDKLEIAGSAFPQGRKARVLFDGALHRPGESAEPDSEVDAEGEVIAPDRIVVPVNEGLLASFCGAGSAASHTTFEGSVTVVFAAQTPGAPPVSGTLQRAVVDVLPSAAGQARYAADAEDGAKLLRVSGLHVEPRPGGGLAVTAVDDGSRAMGAGLLPDDVIVAAGGVRTSGVADLAPDPESGTLALAVHRGGNTTDEVHELVVDSAARSTPRRFALPAALVGGIALLIALLAASPGRRFAWLRRRLAMARATATAGDRVVTFAALATVSALPLAMPNADAGLLALAAWSGALATGLLVGGEHTTSGWRAGLLTLCRIGPSAVAYVMALAVVGSLRADEIVAAQGGAPWSFVAARSPAHAVLALVFCSWAVLQADAGPPADNAMARAADRYVAILHAGLAVTLFLGGWRVPFVPVHPRGLMLLVSAAVFVGKTALVSGLAQRLGAALSAPGGRSLASVARLAWTRLVPLALVSGLGAGIWETRVTSRGVAAAATFAVVAIASAAALQLGWPHRREARVQVDPIA